jgi:hypothetical protein
MSLVVHQKNRTSDTSRLGSPAIWGTCPWDEIENPRSGIDGMRYYDNFRNLPLQGTLTTQIAAGNYKVFGDSGDTITRVSSINSVLVPGGAAQFTTDTDNETVALADSYPNELLTGLATNSKKLWFECSYAQSSVATNMASVFIGLANVAALTLSTTVPHNDGDAIDTGVYAIGFRIEEDGLGVIDTVYTDGAAAFTNIGNEEGGTLVAYTFKKLGFVYDMDAADADRIKFYADNQLLSTRLSGTALKALTNLDANGLGLLFSACADSAGTSFKAFLKWWRIAAIYPS